VCRPNRRPTCLKWARIGLSKVNSKAACGCAIHATNR
jgi:hypothetical protein